MHNKTGDSLCCFPFCCCQVAFIYLLFAICSDKFLFIYINGWPYCLCFIIFKYYYCTLISLFAFANNPRLSNIGYLDFGVWVERLLGPLCADFTDLWVFLFNRKCSKNGVFSGFLIYIETSLYPNLARGNKDHT